MASAASEGAVLVTFKYLYPAIVFLYFFASSLLATCTLQALKKTQNAQPERPSRRTVTTLLGFFLSTYVVQIIILSTQSIIEKSAPVEHAVINYLSCTLVFGILFIQLIETETVVWYTFRGSWFLAFFFELLIATLTAVHIRRTTLNLYDTLHIIFLLLRLALLSILVAWTCFGLWTKASPLVLDPETQSLLPKPNDDQLETQADSGKPANNSNYGSTTQSEATSSNTSESGNTPEYSWERREREARESMEKRLEEGGNWFEYAKGFTVRIISELILYKIFTLSNSLPNND
jgi:hypothetical protein